MSNKSNNLRERAELILKRDAPAQDNNLQSEMASHIHTLLEEFRVYQAELELQNEELRRAQLETKHALAQYSILFKSLPLAALVLDRQGVINDMNIQASELFGFNALNKLIKNSFYHFISDAERPRLYKMLHTEISTPANYIENMTVFGADKTLIMDAHFIHLSIEYHLDNHTLLLLVDRSAEAAHERDRLLFQSMLDNSPSIMEAFDISGYCQLANAAMLTAINRSAEQVIGVKREMWLTLDEATDGEQKDEMVFNTEVPLLEEETFYTIENHKHHYISNRFPLKDKNGDVFAIGAIKTDISAIRQIEARLQLAMQVFSQGSEGIIITDKDNQIISVNKAFERITGYSEAEVIGKNPSLLSSGRHNREFYNNLWKTLLTEGEWEGELYDRRKNGEHYPQHTVLSRVLDDDGKIIHFIGVFNDITHKKQADEAIHQLAFYDPLTGTPNRNLFQNRVSQTIKIAQRENSQFSLMFLDLDYFKEVNDTLGHSIGDDLLVKVAQRLENEIRDEDTMCRFGGDEFVILFNNMSTQHSIIKAERILASVIKPYLIDEHKLTLSVSIGIAIYPDDGIDYASLLKNADMAMYKAKENGRNNYHFFKVEMANLSLKRMAIEAALRIAIDNNELWLAYQPQINIIDKKLTGVEVLLRWKNAELNNPTPDEFIPIAESTGLIVEIGGWVLKEALKQTKKWLDSGIKPFTVAVNISARQFWNGDFAGLVQKTLLETQVPACYLELELTERLVMKKPEAVIKIMNELKLLGIQLSIDDFGTGYSSLSYLKRLPADKLKIDQSFVRDIGTDKDDEVIVVSIVQLAQALHKETIAEGVETIQQKNFLASIGCNTIQGYLYGKPMSITDFDNWLKNSR
jgi:diguanylate cyclase (GGDEF)-like protein/PAS domain S-box-containing protein